METQEVTTLPLWLDGYPRATTSYVPSGNPAGVQVNEYVYVRVVPSSVTVTDPDPSEL